MGESFAGLPLVAESIFLMLALWQCLQRIPSTAEAMSTRLSKVLSQSFDEHQALKGFIAIIALEFIDWHGYFLL